ncbi:ferredoxin [Mycobacterium sp. 2YAF39]|uniref:ferredoxin n=1 Tax=Mycobacterium sp. 2YAF39 TaxID=3233033 RepID=UPI003F9EAA5C
MKVAVDLDTCDGNGVCMSICHEVFDVQEDGLHVLQDRPSDDLRQKLRGAEVSCPTQAITVED